MLLSLKRSFLRCAANTKMDVVVLSFNIQIGWFDFMSSKTSRFAGSATKFSVPRLIELLAAEPDIVIMELNRQEKEYESLIAESNIQENILDLFIQVLGKKICTPTSLEKLRNSLVSKACEAQFLKQLKEWTYSLAEDMDGTLSIITEKYEIVKDLLIFYEFVADTMPNLAADVLYSNISAGVMTTGNLKCKDSMLNIQGLNSKFDELQKKIHNFKTRRTEAMKLASTQGNAKTKRSLAAIDQQLMQPPPDDFRSIPNIPTSDELLSGKSGYLRPVLETGKYLTADNYLDVVFRLLREDFVAPVRDGITHYLNCRDDFSSYKRRMPLGTVRIYTNVRILPGLNFSAGATMHMVQLDMNAYFRKVKWEKSKRLLPGSLVLLTKDDFQQSIHFAVVAKRDHRTLPLDGIIYITWEENKPDFKPNQEFLMMECEVYFEVYKTVLQTLKEIKFKDYPLMRYIVDASHDQNPPVYIKDFQTAIDFGILMVDKKIQTREVLILKKSSWPTCSELGMDESQYEAFQTALTTEFAIIQGPPGTGKTFIGIQIAKLLLANQKYFFPNPRTGRLFDRILSHEVDNEGNGKPVLVVCYTNHALDQFLEAIVDVMEAMGINPLDKLIRVGGQTKSDRMKDLSLYKRLEDARRHGTLASQYSESLDDVSRKRRYVTFLYHRLIDTLTELNKVHGIVDFAEIDSECWDLILEGYYEHRQGKLVENQDIDLEVELEMFLKLIRTNRPNNILRWLGLMDDCFVVPRFDPNNVLALWFRIVPSGSKMLKLEMKHEPVEVCHSVVDLPLAVEEDYDIEELMQNRIQEINFQAQTSSQSRYCIPYLMSPENCFKQRDEHRRKVDKLENLLQTQPDMTNRDRFDFVQSLIECKREIIRQGNLGAFLEALMKAYGSRSIILPTVSKDVLKASLKQWNHSPANQILRSENWAIYFHMVEMIKKILPRKIVKVEEDLVESNAKFDEVERKAQGYILKNAKFVGMTTSGAAKYNSLVRMMESRMVIVEEAAEVLEAQIVTSISEYCTHLILIGDHQQLRPHTTVYRLAKDYGLDVSLFERMFKNGLSTHMLKVQHRMRPEICELIVPTIYPELINDPSVYEYPPVDGMASNLFFVAHTEAESSEIDSASKTNYHEARFLTRLCRHLILQGYSTSQITILTTYVGQMFLIKSSIRDDGEICLGVRVTVVDNFQGEENDIILLSLVRSNEENQIGFLKTDNRICVAISRAKHGLYIIGNMESLTASSVTWQKIKQTLEDKGNFGDHLPLQCQIHGDITHVANFYDFALAPEGGCSKMCETRLKRCGHNCTFICHAKDKDHVEYKCQFPCEKKCHEDHVCRGKCYEEPCPKCLVPMERSLPCGHVYQLGCHINTLDHNCTIPVPRVLLCGHKKDLQCWIDPILYHCDEMILKDLPCGHLQNVKCSETEIRCVSQVPVIIPECEHEVSVHCYLSLDPSSCVCGLPCDTRLICGHACTRVCHIDRDQNHEDYTCQKECVRLCSDGHPCQPEFGSQHKCHSKCPDCKTMVEVELNCCHPFQIPCFRIEDEYFKETIECNYPCQNVLPCEHTCSNKCFEDCGPCLVSVPKKSIDCSHEMNVSCSSIPERRLCEELVPAHVLSACGHVVNVPCKIQDTITSEECLQFCNQPCGQSLFEDGVGCEHTCLGTCSTCIQGRIHQKCIEKCGRILICGHRCKYPCSSLCPPCQEKCEMRCKHSKCKLQCGEPCSPCNEKCELGCKHGKCRKRCGEECNWKPCLKPCPLILNCGHPCVGLCGDLCPPLCRICDKEQLTEFKLLWTEEEEDARFVFLEDCGHVIEMEGLDMHMNLSVVEGGIIMKRCPRCTTVIRNSSRYGNVLRKCLKDVAAVTKKIFGEGIAVVNKRKRLESEIEKLAKVGLSEPNLELFRQFIQEWFYFCRGNSKFKRSKDLNQYELESLDNMLHWLMDANSSLTNTPKNKLTTELKTKMLEKFEFIFHVIIARNLPFSRLEIKQFDSEMNRLSDMHQLYRRASVDNFEEYQVQKDFEIGKKILSSLKPYGLISKQAFEATLQGIDKVMKTNVDFVRVRARDLAREIFSAADFGASWYKCPNGHLYQIGDCGHPNEISKCPTCKETIGCSGVLHVPANGNFRVAEPGHLPVLDLDMRIPDFLE